jgi:hypothetical protein
MVLVASSNQSRFASNANNSIALKNFTAFGFGLPNVRSLTATKGSAARHIAGNRQKKYRRAGLPAFRVGLNGRSHFEAIALSGFRVPQKSRTVQTPGMVSDE